jgi:hypothetical protein
LASHVVVSRSQTRSSRLAIYLRGLTRSRLGWLLVCLHAAWFLLAIANMSPPAPGLGAFLDQGGGSSATLLAGRPFHFEYESLFLKLLILSDLPSMLAMVPLSFALMLLPDAFHLGLYQGSYLGATVLLFGASCQWLLVGNELNEWLVRKGWCSWPREQIHRWFRFLVAAIVITTLIMTPIVNERSRRLGFRQPGISFH